MNTLFFLKTPLKLNRLLLLISFNMLFGQRVVGYYPQWVQSGFPISNIDLSVVTHVNHAFAWPDENANIQSYDNMFNTSNAQTIHGQGRKFLLTLGGWGNDVGFATVAASPSLRITFIDNLIDICDTYGYDGVDLDWEHPNSSENSQNLNLLVAEMDSMFDAHDSELLITMAVPVSNWSGQWYDFPFLKSHVDFFNAMTYDMHGGWSSHAGHNSPLFQSPPGDPDGSCSTAIGYLVTTRGIPRSQINLGLPFWGKKYQATDINESFSGDVIDMWYYEIPPLIGNGWSYQWDSNAFCPYLIKDDQSRIITYDDPESIGYKCEYAKDQDLGGVMIWALGYDVTIDGQELIESIGVNYLDSPIDEKGMVPGQFSMRAYPNPFNSNCIIEFELLQDEFLNIDLYSIRGEFIERLHSGNEKKGARRYAWSVNEMENEISSGVFFISVNGMVTNAIQKIMYLK